MQSWRAVSKHLRTILDPSKLRRLFALENDVNLTKEFRQAKDSLLLSMDLNENEKDMLNRVSLQVHHADVMYQGNASHYLSVGISAIRCIQKALLSSPTKISVDSILDFGCGYGRVLRFLRVMFPGSDITAVEIDRNALNFCHRRFAVHTVQSSTTFEHLLLPERFDLIWCGSVITHISEQAAGSLLQFFHSHLSDQGLCIFTTHGQLSIDSIQNQKITYGLMEDAQHKITREFESNGYGYADYPNQSGYGISAVSHQKMTQMANNMGLLHEVVFVEHGWDNHQDVYGFKI